LSAFNRDAGRRRAKALPNRGNIDRNEDREESLELSS
jgi:hypothetical protein